MSSYPQPLPGFDLGAFNSYYFSWMDKNLTLDQADHRYLHQTGGHITGSLSIDGTCDIGSLEINSSAVDLTSIIGSIHGTISADKAVIVDANKDITGFRYLTATETISAATIDASSYKIGGTTFMDASRNATFATISGTTFATATYSLDDADFGKLDSITNGTAAASKCLVLDASKDITGIRNLSATGTISSASFDASSAFKISDTTVIDSNKDGTFRNVNLLNLVTANSNLDDTDLQRLDGIVAGTAAASKCVVLSSNKDVGIVRRLSIKNLNVQGDTGTTDDYSNLARLLNCIDSSMGNASSRYFTLGKAFSDKNSGEIAYYHTSDGSDDNRMAFGGYGFSNTLSCFGSGTVSVGTTSRSNARLFISNGVGNSTIAGSSQIEILANTGMSQSLAPYTVSNPSIRCDGNIICGGSLYVSSDRRLKTNIHPFSTQTAMKFVKQCHPKMFKLKGEEREQYGYIAQELLAKSFGRLVEFQPDETMKYEGSVYDFDGFRLNVNYDRVSVLLHRAMQQMMTEIEQQREIIEKLSERIGL